MKNAAAAGPKFQQLVEIMQRLRGPGGCPWDRDQTFDSIKPYTLEETYEVIDAIDRRDYPGLAEELGDFILQAVFYAQMAEEQDLFGIGDALDAINAKLIRRHPHVFGEQSAENANDVLRIWGEAKAAGAGFDWENPEQVIEKLHEELAEFDEARRQASQTELEDEMGDLLFVLVNLARFVKVDPEQALRKTNAKFRRRFGYIERRLSELGKTLAQSNIEEMEALWQEAKRVAAQ
jgi:uncharacterized protein YabN with tetrapyrrole methylase and pyrophosphatase domain